MHKPFALLLATVALTVLSGPATATVILPPLPVPEGAPYHPVDTFQPFLPVGCRLVREIHAEQHARTLVRELVVYRLRCDGRSRVAVRRGPWLPAVAPAPLPQR